MIELPKFGNDYGLSIHPTQRGRNDDDHNDTIDNPLDFR
jgi:hypothetical protein